MISSSLPGYLPVFNFPFEITYVVDDLEPDVVYDADMYCSSGTSGEPGRFIEDLNSHIMCKHRFYCRSVRPTKI
jgi:hypothetical protein